MVSYSNQTLSKNQGNLKYWIAETREKSISACSGQNGKTKDLDQKHQGPDYDVRKAKRNENFSLGAFWLIELTPGHERSDTR